MMARDQALICEWSVDMNKTPEEQAKIAEYSEEIFSKPPEGVFWLWSVPVSIFVEISVLTLNKCQNTIPNWKNT